MQYNLANSHHERAETPLSPCGPCEPPTCHLAFCIKLDGNSTAGTSSSVALTIISKETLIILALFWIRSRIRKIAI